MLKLLQIKKTRIWGFHSGFLQIPGRMQSWTGLKKRICRKQQGSLWALKLPISARAIPRQGLASWPVDCPVRFAVGPQVSFLPPELASGRQKPQLDFRGEAATAGDFCVLLQESFHLRVQKASSSSPRGLAPRKQGKTIASHSFQKDTTVVHGKWCKCSPTQAQSHRSFSKTQVLSMLLLIRRAAPREEGRVWLPR